MQELCEPFKEVLYMWLADANGLNLVIMGTWHWPIAKIDSVADAEAGALSLFGVPTLSHLLNCACFCSYLLIDGTFGS